jgi:hypothetical protein
MNDCDWFVGESFAECKAEYLKNYCDDPDSVDDDAHELTDYEMDTLKFSDRSDDGQDETMRTFREQLMIEEEIGGDFPRLFATTEY